MGTLGSTVADYPRPTTWTNARSTWPIDPMEVWSGSIIGSELDTGIELMAHIALISLCEDHLTATAALPIVLLPIQDQENPI
jgi:hypothetical protein